MGVKHVLLRAILMSISVTVMAAGFFLFTVTADGAPSAKPKVLPEVHLKNGKVYHNFTIVAVGTTSVVARWD